MQLLLENHRAVSKPGEVRAPEDAKRRRKSPVPSLPPMAHAGPLRDGTGWGHGALVGRGAGAETLGPVGSLGQLEPERVSSSRREPSRGRKAMLKVD